MTLERRDLRPTSLETLEKGKHEDNGKEYKVIRTAHIK